MTEYLDKYDTIPEYMPYPRFLLQMDLSHTAKLIYTLFLDRYNLSRMNQWLDEDGHVYLVYPIDKLAETLGMSGTGCRNAVNELVSAGLIERKRHGFSSPNRLYVRIPEDTKMTRSVYKPKAEDGEKTEKSARGNDRRDWILTPEESHPIPPENLRNECRKTDDVKKKDAPDTAGKLAVTEQDNLQSYSKETAVHSASEAAPNNIILNNNTSNNIIPNQECACAESFGEYGNVMLTRADYEKLMADFPDTCGVMIDFLSVHMHDNSREMEDHAGTLRRMLEC